MKAGNELAFGETYINRENFEAMQGFHAGNRKSGIGGAVRHRRRGRQARPARTHDHAYLLHTRLRACFKSSASS
jgi:hypothetical protein